MIRKEEGGYDGGTANISRPVHGMNFHLFMGNSKQSMQLRSFCIRLSFLFSVMRHGRLRKNTTEHTLEVPLLVKITPQAIHRCVSLTFNGMENFCVDLFIYLFGKAPPTACRNTRGG